jgi:hypothetical protein
MMILYSTNEHYYSKAHRFIAKEPFTHIGILFFPGVLDIVLDCTRSHSKIYHLRHWGTKYNITNAQKFDLDDNKEMEYYNRAVDYCLLKPYDWGAYVYAWYWAVRRWITGENFPETNPWKGDGMWCTEVVYPIIPLLKRDFEIDLSGIDLAAKTPFMLYNLLEEK